MLDMQAVADRSMDAVYSAHNLERVHAFEVPTMLRKFLRVLRPEGLLVTICPDLQAICTLVAQDKLTDPVYHSPAGPVTPLDILYGHGAALAAGHRYMAHKCGFTFKIMTQALRSSSFQTMAGKRRLQAFSLWILASKSVVDEPENRRLARAYLPE